MLSQESFVENFREFSARNAASKTVWFLLIALVLAGVFLLPFNFSLTQYHAKEANLANLYQDAESRVLQQPLEAIQLIEQGLALIADDSDPEKLRFLTLQLFAYHNSFQLTRAANVTETLIKLLQSNASNYPTTVQVKAYLLLAKSKYATADWAESIHYASIGLDRVSLDQFWLRNELLFIIANAHLVQKNTGQATGVLSQLKYPFDNLSFPNSSPLQMSKLALTRASLSLLIELYLSQGQEEGAERAFKQLVAIDENSFRLNSLLQSYLYYYERLKQYGKSEKQNKILHKAMVIGQLSNVALENRVALARTAMNFAIESMNEGLARERFYQLKQLDEENAFQPLILKSIARFLQFIGANEQAKEMSERFLRAATRETYLAREIAALSYSQISEAIAEKDRLKEAALEASLGYRQTLIVFGLCVALTLLLSLLGLSHASTRQHRQTLTYLREYLNQMGTRDKPTQLLNRRGLHSQMEFEFNKRSNAGKKAALIFVNLQFTPEHHSDRNSNTLDDLSHMVQSLRRHFPLALIARWGDESIVLFTFSHSLSSVKVLAKQWRESFVAQQDLIYQRKLELFVGFCEKREGMTLSETIKIAESTSL